MIGAEELPELLAQFLGVVGAERLREGPLTDASDVGSAGPDGHFGGHDAKFVNCQSQ